MERGRLLDREKNARRALLASVVMAFTMIACSSNGETISVPAYHYVSPPSGAAKAKLAARGASGVYPLTPKSQGFFLRTPDGQLSVQFPRDVVAARAGEAFFVVTITPRDPLSLGAPPTGYRYDGNAYSVRATYRASGKPIRLIPKNCIKRGPLDTCPEVSLRSPAVATDAYLLADSDWKRVTSRAVPEIHSFIVVTHALGTFVAMIKTS